MYPLLFAVSITCLVILLLIFVLRRFHQPYLIAYIIAGIILGPHVTGIFSSTGNIVSLGEIGILLLMFFLGIEINIPDKRTYSVSGFTCHYRVIALMFHYLDGDTPKGYLHKTRKLTLWKRHFRLNFP
jgi:Kef-type K+ transport system membrane component KefB